MEKLLKLLNEYKPLNKWVHYEYNNRLFIMYDWTGREIWTSIEDEILISKSYWFIKWLYYNNKLDYIDLVVKHEWENYDGSDTEYYDGDESLLMLLSIQDKPIDFLIGVLK